MYEHIKARFNLRDEYLDILLKSEDCEELFQDYELLLKQSQKYPAGSDQYKYYKDMLFELEEEIIELLITLQEGHTED